MFQSIQGLLPIEAKVRVACVRVCGGRIRRGSLRVLIKWIAALENALASTSTLSVPALCDAHRLLARDISFGLHFTELLPIFYAVRRIPG